MEKETPKQENGCVINSWRCENPSRDDMKHPEEGELHRNSCKTCPVCEMVFCQQHMENPEHLRDCNFRSNQEREILMDRQKEENEKKKARIAREAFEKKEKEKKEKLEKIRRENIARRNKQYMTKG